MNILMVVSNSQGGGAKHVQQLSEGLVSLGHKVTIVAPSSNNFANINRIKFVSIDFMKSRFNPITLLALKRVIDSDSFDIVHAHGTRAGWYCSIIPSFDFNNPKFVYTEHAFSFSKRNGQISEWFWTWIENVICTRARMNIMVSRSDYDIAITKKLTSPSKLKVIYYGVESPRFPDCDEIASLRAQLGISEKAIVIGTVGRFVEQKGIEYLIKALPEVVKKFPQAICILVGDGPLRNRFENLIKDLSLSSKVLITGWQPVVTNFITLMDVLIIPSLWEGLPYVLLESMAVGKPVIATPVNGIPESIVNGENGVLVPTKDPDAIANALIYVLSNANLRIRMGENTRFAFHSKFSLDKMISETEQLYKHIFDP